MSNRRMNALHRSAVAVVASGLLFSALATPIAAPARPAPAFVPAATVFERATPALRADSRANPLEQNGAVCSPGTTTPSETISVEAYGPAEWMAIASGSLAPGYWYSCGPYTTLQTIITYSFMQNSNNWNNTMIAASSLAGERCTACFVSTNLPSTGINISQVTKKAIETVATLNTCSGCVPAGVADDSLGNVYASMQASNSSGTGQAIFIWAQGATSPTEVLLAPGSSSVTAAGIAVDAKHNIYWGTNPDGSGSSVIYRFAPDGSGYASGVPFAKANFLGGIVYASKFGKVKGAILAAEPALGEVAVFDSTGRQQQSVQTGGSPQSIGLSKDGTTIFVADPTNARLSAYSSTGASLNESGPIYVTVNGQTYAATVMGVADYKSPKK
jgi:hypothetical protein